MNDAFESPDGTICVVYSDRSPRPRQLFQVDMTKDGLGPQIGDIGLAWYPSYPVPIHRLRPVHPNWIGVVDPAFEPSGIDPSSWLPHYTGYLAAPRLHRPAPRFTFDPLSGDAMNVAVRMSWDPHPKAPLVRRPHLASTQFAYVSPSAVITSGTECVEMADEQGASPAITGQGLTTPTILSPAVTSPTILNGDVC